MRNIQGVAFATGNGGFFLHLWASSSIDVDIFTQNRSAFAQAALSWMMGSQTPMWGLLDPIETPLERMPSL
jgi:hypothetical protein